MNQIQTWVDRHPLEFDMFAVKAGLLRAMMLLWTFWLSIKVHGVWATVDKNEYRGSHAGTGRGNRKRTFGASSPTHDGLPNLQTTLRFARSTRLPYTPFPSFDRNYETRYAAL